MRALAVSSPTAMDGIPSLKEQGIDVVFGNWRGIWGGPGITPPQREALIKQVKAGTETAEWKAMLAKPGSFRPTRAAVCSSSGSSGAPAEAEVIAATSHALLRVARQRASACGKLWDWKLLIQSASS